MFDIDTPRPWHNFIWLGVSVGGYKIALGSPRWEADLAGVVFLLTGCIIAASSDIRLTIHEKNNQTNYAALDHEQAARDQIFRDRAVQQAAALPKLNIFQQGKKPVYASALVPVKIDKERAMAKTLVDMLDGGLEPNLTETYWIKGGHWKDSREAFVLVRDKWVHYQIISKKRDTQRATYEILNGDGLRKIAQGRVKLPPLS